MVMTNTDRLGRALDLLRDGLRPKVDETWKGFYGDDWLQVLNSTMHHPQSDPSTEDIAFVLSAMKATWNDVFRNGFSPDVRALVFEVSKVRNSWAHQERLSSDNVNRGLDSMERLLEAFGNLEERQEIKQLRMDLMRQMFDQQARSERKKTAAKPTEGQPQAGLTPWREIVTPHADVQSGDFEQAEFAANLHEVAEGEAGPEYQDPREFFSRTYLTEGLRDLLVGAARRLSSGPGDPIIELQTNFGGGKTHSMIALYHLASRTPPSDLLGVGEALAEEEIELPTEINRAVLVGQMISPSAPEPVADDILLHTLWGRLAWQLGGRDGYELVRKDDEAGTNPGRAIKELFKRYGPAVVLVDEWVAYARQLPDGSGDKRPPGGDFDTQFTFAQALTEAAALVPNVVVLVSIPASDIEVGGERGRTALERLKNVVTRTAAQWQPASPDESFEIVRRRLFDPTPANKATVRDGVIRAFMEMYRASPEDFPSAATEREFERRMQLSYPIHPELFDRLFTDWSALEKFQRTRGVLRFMALVVTQLWQRGDQSLLIMPGNLPMDSGLLVSEMKKYVEDSWDAIIKSDVDGDNSLPLTIDREHTHFGKLSATRRVARTVYMGSAPRPDGSRGVDLKSIVLGCVQPGEPVKQFGDALRRLTDRATHLYVDGAQYWYSLKPNVTRVAADRAVSNFTDRDADDEVRSRLGAQRDLGDFAAIQVFTEGPGDVPDDDDGVRLVVLEPDATHSANDDSSPAVELASRILAQRESGPRLNRNLLIFVAAAANRLSELRRAARMLLAWKSIVADEEKLELTSHQKQQAQSKVSETSQQVDSLIGETFAQALVPSQTPGTPDIEWSTVRVPTQGDVGARVSKKLASSEQLIAGYGGARVKMDIDNHELWSERQDLAVGILWQVYARYPYMPRLASREVLDRAIGDGTSNLAWQTETFGYAQGHDGKTWVGVKTGEHLTPTPSGLLIHPDHVPERIAVEQGGAKESPAGAVAETGASYDTASGPTGGADAAPPTSFYARFDLDPVRGIKQLGDVFDHVVKHLGGDVELHLEVRATSADGYDDATRRTVVENVNNLGGKAPEFE